MKIRKIIFPVDFSRRSAGAANYVEALAATFQPAIKLIHVLPPPHYEAMSLEVTGPALVEVLESRRKLAGEQLAEFLTTELKGLPVERRLIDGDPATQIIRVAHEENADLIVMPTHGYGPFRRFILGSVAAKVLHDADCPVLTGVHLDVAPPREEIAFRKVIAAVDFGTVSERTLTWAAGFAKAMNAKLIVTHVTNSVSGQSGEYFDPEWKETFARPAREKMDQLLAKLGLKATVVIDWGEPSKQICELAEAEKADLLVIGRSHSEGVLGRLRTHAYAIVRMSPCPVVSV